MRTQQRGDGKLVRYLRNTNPELNVIERAIQGGWPITEEKRAEIVTELMEMVRGPNRCLAVKAARILKDAVADDRRHEIAILDLLYRDQQDAVTPYGATIDVEAAGRLEQMDTEALHEFMDQLSGVPRLTSDEDAEDED